MAVNPKTSSQDKNAKTQLGLTLAPAASSYPISYVEDNWDVVQSGSDLAAVLGATGQFDQHSINEALAGNSGGGDTYSGAATVTVGGITTGQTFTNATFQQVVDALINPYAKPSATLTLSVSTAQEYGATISSVTMSVAAVKNTNPIYGIKFKVGDTVVDTQTGSSVADGGTFTYTYSTSFSTDTTFSVIVSDNENYSASGSSTDTKTVSFSKHVYYGSVSSTTAPTSSTGLSHAASVSSGVNITTASGEYVVFMSPTSKTSIQQLIIGTWYDIATTNKGTVTFTLSTGATETYYCYMSNQMVAATEKYKLV